MKREEAYHAERAKEWIEGHYREKFVLTELADAMFVNKDYLGRCFKKKHGYTPLQYHNLVRCEHARVLLREGKYSVNVIGDQVGYVTTSHFIKVFKSIHGITPAEYRIRETFVKKEKLEVSNKSFLEHYSSKQCDIMPVS